MNNGIHGPNDSDRRRQDIRNNPNGRYVQEIEMHGSTYSSQGVHRYRSRRRRRRHIIKVVLLWVLVIAVIIGIVIFAIKLTKKKNPLATAETDSQTVTEQVTTSPADTASGVLKDGYSTVSILNSEVHRGDLILVRSGADYVFPDDNSNLVNVFGGRKTYGDGSKAFQLSSTNIQLDKHVLDELNALTETFYETTGKNALLITSAYRSLVDQQEILDYKTEQLGEEEALKYVALPGVSEHHTGYAFDMSIYEDGVNTYIQDNEDYFWVNENAHRYGLVLRYPEDKMAITGINFEGWHFRYVGFPHAYYMFSEDLCLEEYIDLLRAEYSYAGKHLTVTDDGEDGDSTSRKYEIYYVPASSSDKTDIIVPTGYNYTISGNNTDGFIVTVMVG